jgi:signal transduction histidine kinase
MRQQARLKVEIETALIKTQEINRAKSDFLSRLSHEMRTPMNAIMGMAQVARIKSDPEKTQKCLKEIEAASMQLMIMINDLLDISGKNTDPLTIAESEFSFSAMLQYIRSSIDRDAAKKKHTLDFNVDPLLPDLLVGDEKRLSQVILNLLTNAVNFTPENGTIRFSVYIVSEIDRLIFLQIEVADNGIGISQEHQSEIFKLFEQADGGLTRKQGGIGVGLPLADYIVGKMGGKIWVESKPGEGSKFTFTFNLKKV